MVVYFQILCRGLIVIEFPCIDPLKADMKMLNVYMFSEVIKGLEYHSKIRFCAAILVNVTICALKS